MQHHLLYFIVPYGGTFIRHHKWNDALKAASRLSPLAKDASGYIDIIGYFREDVRMPPDYRRATIFKVKYDNLKHMVQYSNLPPND